MASTLLDPPSPQAPGKGRPRRRVLTGLGAAALAGLLVVGAAQVLDLPGLGNPFTEESVDRKRPALELALSDLSDYRAAKGTYQVVVDLEQDTRFVPSIVRGERTTYLAVGSVDGLVDLRDLGPDAVRVEGDSVTFELPPPRLGDPAVDLEQSRVLARDRGVLDRLGGVLSDSPTSEREVALSAEGQLLDAAAQSDLLDRTEQNTRAMLTELARSLGYTDVTVRFDADTGT